jgi:hypothetical protein
VRRLLLSFILLALLLGGGAGVQQARGEDQSQEVISYEEILSRLRSGETVHLTASQRPPELRPTVGGMGVMTLIPISSTLWDIWIWDTPAKIDGYIIKMSRVN